MAAAIEAKLPLDDAEAMFMHAPSEVPLRHWNGIEVGTLRAAPALRSLRGA